MKLIELIQSMFTVVGSLIDGYKTCGSVTGMS